jgi:glycosyltransferase involved in cell wall biosynthesis
MAVDYTSRGAKLGAAVDISRPRSETGDSPVAYLRGQLRARGMTPLEGTVRQATVVIPVRDDPAGLESLLGSLAKQTVGPADFEVIVVDDGSSPPVYLNTDLPFPTEVIRQDASGSYAARNQGLERAEGLVVAFTDAGCRPEPSWLEEGLRAVEASARPIAGEIDVPSPVARRPTVAETYDSRFGFDQRSFVEDLHFGATANLFVPREVFAEVGTFDPRLRSGGDLQWGRRAHRAGFPIGFSSTARVVHPPRRTLRELWRQHRRYRRGHIELAALHPEYRLPPSSGSVSDRLRSSMTLWPAIQLRRAVVDGELRGRSVVRCTVGAAVVVAARVFETASSRFR